MGREQQQQQHQQLSCELSCVQKCLVQATGEMGDFWKKQIMKACLAVSLTVQLSGAVKTTAFTTMTAQKAWQEFLSKEEQQMIGMIKY